MLKKLLNTITQKKLIGEILRFIIVGGVATVIDFSVMAFVLFLFAPENYTCFWSIFLGGTKKTSTLAALVSTGVGFLIGLVANYILSVFFVFNEKGTSKSTKGFLLLHFYLLADFYCTKRECLCYS